MSKEEEQRRAAEDYRTAIEKSVENDDQIGQYAYNENWNATEAERLRERGRELDENESAAKERYEELNCEEVTGLDADSYRHEVISEKVDREMEEERERKRAEIAASMQNSNENSNHL